MTRDLTNPKLVLEALEDFFNKKKELDYNDRFNGIMFTKKGPRYLSDFTLNQENLLEAIKQLEGK